MSKSLGSSARGAISSFTRHGSYTALPRLPFVCNRCRRAALQRSKIAVLQPRRCFTAARTPYQQASAAEARRPQREAITPQTLYDFFPETFPQGPPPHSSFMPDLRQLRKEFLQLQAKTHPDLAPSDRKRHAEAVSMRLNEAYKTIQDPLQRARYLLALRGIDVEDESAQIEENDLLMEVMEVREAVEEVENEEQLSELRVENNARIDQSIAVLDEAFAKNDVELAAQEAIRLRYWTNIEESISGWEKGSGGGLLHH